MKGDGEKEHDQATPEEFQAFSSSLSQPHFLNHS